ncbi:SCO0607 family lipoprotein [Streptomyces sp. NPDC059582]|uniref:SCO0607 family lipoprotein n=1 Tax=Streptomyces sp. NPDC059582 TaxID=3346875 RepID=UPI003688AEE2
MPRRAGRPTTAFRPRGLKAVGAALVGAAAVVALTGCSGLEYQEAICSSGEYPVLTVNGTGSACTANDEKPPSGYTRYPKGKVPQQVGDKWDVYWDTHTLDEDGNIIDAPDGG